MSFFFSSLCCGGGIRQLCHLLSLRSLGEREEHQHHVVDAAAARSPPHLHGNSNSTGGLRRHGGSSALQKSGVPSPSGTDRV